VERDTHKKSLDMLYGVPFSDRCYHALKSRAERAEALVPYAVNATKLLEGILAAKGTSAWEWAADIEAVLAKAPK
jgi:hypothetical protein